MNELNRPRRAFDEGFKREAVALLLRGGKSTRALAQELGVSQWNLRDWKKRYAPLPDPRSARSPAELEVENRLLRREVDSLRTQRDILKKTLGILSEPPSSGLSV